MKKYHQQTYDLVIKERCDGDHCPYGRCYKDLKRINSPDKQKLERIIKMLDNIFSGINLGLIFKIEDGPILNTLAIRSNRDQMLKAQIADLKEGDYDMWRINEKAK